MHLTTLVSISVSVSLSYGLINIPGRMQQILRKCSEYLKNRILGTALVYPHNIVSLFQFLDTVYRIIGFQRVCVFPTATSVKVLVLVSNFIKKLLTTTLAEPETLASFIVIVIFLVCYWQNSPNNTLE